MPGARDEPRRGRRPASSAGEIENRLERVGRYHPSRLVLCAVEPGRTTIDAWASVGRRRRGPTGPHRGRRASASRSTSGRATCKALDTIVDPLLVPDLATLVWAPHGHAEARRRAAPAGADRARRLPGRARRRRLRSRARGDLIEQRLRGRPRVAALDAVARARRRRLRPAAAAPRRWRRSARVTVRHRADSAAAAAAVLRLAVLAPGLAPGLAVAARRRRCTRPRPRAAAARSRSPRAGRAAAARPGLAGVTIEMASGGSLSLDRGPGGLRRVRRARDGSEQVWTVLGASRGEARDPRRGRAPGAAARPDLQAGASAARAMVA